MNAFVLYLHLSRMGKGDSRAHSTWHRRFRQLLAGCLTDYTQSVLAQDLCRCLLETVCIQLDTVKQEQVARKMDSRERVLKAAVELMNREGLAALSMREVARRAGVSHQAPYHYFANREAVLAAIAEEGFKKFNAALELASGRNATDRLVATGRIYVDFALSHPAHFHVMFRPDLVDLQKYALAQAEASRGFGILQSLVDELVKEKFLPARLARGMTTLTWSFVQGLSELLLEGPLAKMAGNDLKSNDEIESALRTFGFLISAARKKRL